MAAPPGAPAPAPPVRTVQVPDAPTQQQSAGPQRVMSQEGARAIYEQAMRPRFVGGRPAQTVRTGMRKEVQREGYDPEAQEMVDEGIVSQRLALQTAEDAELAENQARVSAASAASAQYEDFVRKQQQRVQFVQQEADRRMGEVDARRAELDAAPEVDATRFFDNIGPLGTIMAAIAVGIGGIQAGYQGGPNRVLEQINRAVDNDIAAQREKIARKSEGITGAENALARFTQLHGDPATAESELKIHMLDLADRKASLYAMKTQDQKIRANYELMHAEIEQQRARELSKLRGGVESIAENYADIQAQRGGYARPSLKHGREAVEEYVKTGKLIEEAGGVAETEQGTKLFFGGKPVGVAQTKEEGVALRKELSDMESLDRNLGDLVHAAENWSKWSPEQRKRTLSTKAFAQLASKGEAGFALGVLAGPDLEMIQQAIPEDPMRTFDLGTIAQLKQTRENFRRRVDSRVKNQGVPINTLPWQNVKRAD
jgi:hypothetical protein